MILVFASTLALMAATARPGPMRPDAAEPTRFPSADALRHYAAGRLLEERGESDAAVDQYYRALVGDPRSGAAARRVSELAARADDIPRSLEFARRALAVDPNDARAHWLEGVALFQQGDGAGALAALETAVRLDSSSAEYLQALAHVGHETGHADVEERALRQLVGIRDDDAEAWFQLAVMAARQGRFTEADSALDQAVDLNPDRPGADFLRGWVSESLGRDSLAIAAFQRHLAAHASDQVTRRRLVTLLARQQRFPEAYREAKRVSMANERDADALMTEADLAFSAGEVEAGRALVARLEREHADDVSLISALIGLEVREGRAADGLGIADRWASAHAGDYRGPLLQARAALLAGRNDAALARAQAALALAPDSVATLETLARVYQGQRRWALAESAWAGVARRAPGSLRFPLQVAYCREQNGDIDGAVAVARDVLSRAPDDPEAQNSLGYLLADHNRELPEAERLIARALEREPENGAFLDSMGWVHFRLGRLAQARSELERAVSLTSGDPEVCEHLGDVYKELKLTELARQLYRRSLQRDTSNARVRAKLEGSR